MADYEKTEAYRDAYGGLHNSAEQAIHRSCQLRREIAVDILVKRASSAISNREAEMKAWLMNDMCDDLIIALAEAATLNREARKR